MGSNVPKPLQGVRCHMRDSSGVTMNRGDWCFADPHGGQTRGRTIIMWTVGLALHPVCIQSNSKQFLSRWGLGFCWKLWTIEIFRKSNTTEVWVSLAMCAMNIKASTGLSSVNIDYSCPGPELFRCSNATHGAPVPKTVSLTWGLL